MSADRFTELADRIFDEMRRLEMGLLDDAAPDEGEQFNARRELLDELLEREVGPVTTEHVVLVLCALPIFDPAAPENPQQVIDFADFLRREFGGR